MKRKAVLIILVLLISSILGFMGNNFQKKLNSQISSNKKITLADSSKAENGASKIESNTESSNTTDTTVTPSEKKITEDTSITAVTKSSTNIVSPKSNTVKPETTPPAVQQTKANFYIIDTVSNTINYSSEENFSGMTVADITIKVLNRQHISNHIISSFLGDYFSMIAGLEERSAGDKSGWCFYINGQKSSVGASDSPLNASDKLEWKFLKDGL